MTDVTPATPRSTKREAQRSAIVAAALGLLESDGPQALTTKRIGDEIGASTMAVYTAFGSLGHVVEAIVTDGFQQLQRTLAQAREVEDPLAGLWGLLTAYRQFALSRPHLFRAMYATAPVGGYIRTGEALLIGTEAFAEVVTAVERALDAGELAAAPAYDLALAGWSATHGAVLVELAGYTAAMPPPATATFDLVFIALMIGSGADPARVAAVVSGEPSAVPAARRAPRRVDQPRARSRSQL
ncbi:TetR/AcrR family transcriptional regulator [Nocardioides sp.]|uniref:TetR/AcrR family transcriptional regulator n=1 Tax=Nocardioides sp. TaxID=35761 RepID=UPI002CABBB27|nr:TetR/AcrR family transcriptional regulator [Nocardioides sp.]HSX68326.1 TetR/AcrR family transcriptional regulator [Nocardioides sp.]